MNGPELFDRSWPAYLNFNGQLLRHSTHLLVPNHGLLLQAKQHRDETLNSVLQRFGVPCVWRRTEQWLRRGRIVVQREQRGKEGCIICEVFLGICIRLNLTERGYELTCTSLTTSNSSASARRSMVVLLSMLLKSAECIQKCHGDAEAQRFTH